MLNFNDFLGYAAHQTEMENLIESAVDAIRNGEEDITLDLIDDFSPSELAYIQSQIEDRI